MKSLIENTEFIKEYDTKFGTNYLHKITYAGGYGLYSSKKKDQNYFTVGKEAEFTEETISGKNGKPDWTKVSPIRNKDFGNYSKNVQKEQARYSGFATSYVKDLIISGHIDIEQWEAASEKIFNFMVQLDKSIK